jgi:hypothetical protein
MSLISRDIGLSGIQQTSSFLATGINYVIYGNNQYVAVGGDGKIATSPNGINWTQQTSSFGTSVIHGIAYGNNLYVAVGFNGKIATSPDGINWTQQTSSFDTTTVRGAIYGNSLYVAVGDSGKLATSPDGINWTQQTSSFGTSSIYDVTYGNNQYVAVGGSGKIATSPDGINWTQQTSYFGTSSIFNVIYGDNLYVSTGQDGKLVTSSNGINWTQRTSSFGTTGISALAYGNNLYIAGGQGGKLATSPDGINWTQQQASFFGTLWISAATYGNNQYIVTDTTGKLGIFTSYLIPYPHANLDANINYLNTKYGRTVGTSLNSANSFSKLVLTEPTTIPAPTGTPIDGQMMTVFIQNPSNILGYNSIYRVFLDLSEVATAGSAYLAMIYNAQDLKWDILDIVVSEASAPAGSIEILYSQVYMYNDQHGSGPSITIPKPVGVENGDVLLFVIGTSWNSLSGSIYLNPAVSLLESTGDGDSGVHVFRRVSNGTEPTNYQVVWDEFGGNAPLTACIIHIRGSSVTLPLENRSFNTMPKLGSEPTIPSVTPTAAGTAIFVAASDAGELTGTLSVQGATQLHQIVTDDFFGGNSRLYIGMQEVPVGATGIRSVSYTGEKWGVSCGIIVEQPA